MVRLSAGIHLRRPGYRILSALVLALIVAGIVLVARLFGSVSSGGPTNGEPTPAPPETVSSTEGDDSVYAASPSSASRAPSAAAEVGEAFVRAWLQPTDGRSQEQWYTGLARYAMPDLATQLRDVDPTTNPAKTVTGAPTATVVSETSAQVVVPTDAGRATTLCVLIEDGWRVATIDLAA